MAAGDKNKGGLATVVKRFPEQREALHRLFMSNLLFQSLCEEYEDCLAALRYWRESNSSEALRLQKEFSSLLSDLEEEILISLRRDK
jgi:hypothetical protein